MKRSIGFLWIGLTILSLTGCVSQKKFTDLEGRYRECTDEVASLRQQRQDLENEKKELSSTNTRLREESKKLGTDTLTLGQALRDAKYDMAKLNKSHDELLEAMTKMQSGSQTELQRLLGELQVAQEKLSHKQDSLRSLERELAGRQKRLAELERMLAKQDSLTIALRKKVADALLSFQGKGLTVTMKNGKVYVSLEESLLFKSGSYDVGTRGESALQQLASVLASNPDISVMIEGHTDNVPYRGSGQLKDNWDLSVMRATQVVKILMKNKLIDPSRLTAAGRSEYLPLTTNATPEGKASNRRTEIILTPKLDELYKLIEGK